MRIPAKMKEKFCLCLLTGLRNSAATLGLVTLTGPNGRPTSVWVIFTRTISLAWKRKEATGCWAQTSNSSNRTTPQVALFWVGLLSQRFWLRPDVLFWPPVHGCQRFQPEHSLLRQTKPTFTWKIITFKVSSAQAQRRPIKSCVQPETNPPRFFVGSVPCTHPPELGQNWTESSTVACAIVELFCPHKQNCSSPSAPICSPVSRFMFSKGNLSWSVVILTHWMWSSTRCKRAPASGQTVTSRAQSKLSWSAGSGAATLMCQIEIRHAFCFLLDYWNIWAQIIYCSAHSV